MTKPATTDAADLRPRTLRNCWTCALSGPRSNGCDALTLDEDVDAPILDWLEAAPLRDDGTVPEGADGCPGWEATW